MSYVIEIINFLCKLGMLSFQIFIKCDMRRGQQRMKWLNGITDSLDMRLSKLREIVKDMEAWHSVLHGIAKNQK